MAAQEETLDIVRLLTEAKAQINMQTEVYDVSLTFPPVDNIGESICMCMENCMHACTFVTIKCRK